MHCSQRRFPSVRPFSLSMLLLAAAVAGCDDESDDSGGAQSQAATDGSQAGNGGAAGGGGAGAGAPPSAVEGSPCGGPGGGICGDGLFCDHSGTPSCDEVGLCRARPQGCVDLADPEPACGCDGQLYSSRCDANVRGIALSPGGVGCD
jgi:hypothetical protein